MPTNPLLLQINIQKQSSPVQTRQTLQRWQRQNNGHHGHRKYCQTTFRSKNPRKPFKSKELGIHVQYKPR